MFYDFIAIDFETANSDNSSACAMGLAFVKDLEIVDAKYYLIKPPTDEFSDYNTKIHGITYNDVKDSPTFDVLWPRVRRLIKSSPLLAHNAQFDISVLLTCCEKYEIPMPHLTYFENISFFSAAFPGHKKKSLDYCANFLEIPLDNHHNALEDAVACAKVAIKSLLHIKALPMYEMVTAIHKIKPKLTEETKFNRTFDIPNFVAPKTKIKISELSATVEEIRDDHPFYGKSIVFTGDLISIDRKEAMQSVVNLGAVVRSSVSKLTNYLVVGEPISPGHKTTKERKALDLLEKCNHVILLNEDEFLKLLK